MTNKKKILLWCGSAANQRALATKLSQQFSIAAIIIDEKIQQRKRILFDMTRLVADRLRFRKIYDAWSKLQSYYNHAYPSWPIVPILKVNGINCDEAYEFSRNIDPALIVVSGTSLIKKQLLTTPSEIGIINLHTGLSPYVKGGPNCTNWCIANNDWHLVGNTIMWIDAGIDSGNIITSETVDIRQSSSLFEAQKTVMEHAHTLYLRSVRYLLNASPPYQSVMQSTIGQERLFLSKMWGTKEKGLLLKNWKNRSDITDIKVPDTIPLPSIADME